MVAEEGLLCRSCELTRTRPNDDDPTGLAEFVHHRVQESAAPPVAQPRG
jgi:hypothetical protein